MLIGELFEKLGLKTDAASFAKGALAAKGVEVALAKIGEIAGWVTDQLKQATFGAYAQADGLDDLAAKTGVSAQTLQELGYAGSFADVSMETLAGSLRSLQRNMVGAIEGNAELKSTFRQLKVSLVDASGHVRSTEDVFTDLVDRFSDMPESAARSTIAMKVFGKAGAELLPILMQGHGALADFRKEYVELGGNFSDDFIHNSAELEDNIQRLKTAWSGVQGVIAEALLPTFKDLVGTTLEWVKANQVLIRTKIKEWVEDAVATVRFWVASIREWVKEQGGLPAVIDKVSRALKILAAYLVVKEVLDFARALFEIPKALQAIRVAIAANPIGLLVTLVAAAAVAIYENWDDIRAFGLEVVWLLERAWTGLGEFFSGFGDGLYSILVQPFVDAWDWIKKTWDDGVAWIERKLARLGEIIADAVDVLNPFSIDDNTTSGQRGTPFQGGSAAEDAAFLAQRQAAGLVPPTLVERPAGKSVSIVSNPQFTITASPGQNEELIARIAAQKVAEHNRDMLREAAGGI